MKWFSFKAIIKEIGKIRWPKKDDLLVNSVQVILFTAFFALFFYLCQFLVTMSLTALGIIG